jgi:septin family protein
MYHHDSHLSLRSRRTAQNDSFQEIVGYLERQYDDILAEESRIIRNARFRDNRVHALLYFIPPTGHAYVLNPFRYVVPLDP